MTRFARWVAAELFKIVDGQRHWAEQVVLGFVLVCDVICIMLLAQLVSNNADVPISIYIESAAYLVGSTVACVGLVLASNYVLDLLALAQAQEIVE